MLAEEKILYEKISEEIYSQVKGRYKILEIRTRQLMQRYTQEIEKRNPDFKIINSLEEALTRIDSRVNELLREMRGLSTHEIAEDNGSIGDLVDILAEVRNRRLNP